MEAVRQEPSRLPTVSNEQMVCPCLADISGLVVTARAIQISAFSMAPVTSTAMHRLKYWVTFRFICKSPLHHTRGSSVVWGTFATSPDLRKIITAEPPRVPSHRNGCNTSYQTSRIFTAAY